MKRGPTRESDDRRWQHRFSIAAPDASTVNPPRAVPAAASGAAPCAESAADTSGAREYTGRVVAICISQARGTVKHPVSGAELQANHGIVGDAHAGPWPRQVSLLPAESIERIQAVLPEIKFGAFAENIVTENIDYASLQVGVRCQLGRAVLLEVTQVGKECHTACAIGQATGDCIMPREGVFCRVVRGGCLHTGDPIRVTGRSLQDQ